MREGDLSLVPVRDLPGTQRPEPPHERPAQAMAQVPWSSNRSRHVVVPGPSVRHMPIAERLVHVFPLPMNKKVFPQKRFK